MKPFLTKICFFILVLPTLCFAGEKAVHDAYFDASTGHKYLKQQNNTYAEYSQKGIFLKIVPSDLPLLIKRSTIFPISQDNYILYEKSGTGLSNRQFLPGKTSHPKGWKAKKLLISMN